MNEKKFCFITCLDDRYIYDECLRYINNLYVPEGYEVEIISIENTKNVSSRYNEAMKSSEAKYKIYLNEDTFIINKDFLLDILYIFEKNSDIGMLGVCGCEKISTSGIWWQGLNLYGRVYKSEGGLSELLNYKEVSERYKEVEVIDSLIMVTQYDIEWREDIFKSCDFYDVSQCLEFQRAGHKVVVPKQIEPWCLKDSSIDKSGTDYEEYRNIFIKEYCKDFYPRVSVILPTYNNLERFKKTLENILEQTYQNKEIIVIHDEEIEEIKTICNFSEDIKYYKNTAGIKENENIDRALKIAEGDYLYIVEKNQLLNKNKIEKMIDYFIKYDVAIVLNTSKNQYTEESLPFNEDKKDMYLTGIEANNYIINNYEKFINNYGSAMINKKYYINQYATFKNKKYMSIKDISTWCNTLKYGDMIYIKDNLDYRYEGVEINVTSAEIIYKLLDLVNLVNALNEERLFKNMQEYTDLMEKLFDDIMINIKNMGDVDRDKLLEEMMTTKDLLVIKNIQNFFHLGNNIVIKENCRFMCPEGMDIGNKVDIFESSTFMIPFFNLEGSPRIIIKDGCSLGKRLFVSATNKITIENDVVIAANVHITDHNHEYRKIGIPIKEQGVTSFTNEVVIGAGSWIANNCVIVGNVKIGRGCVIGANSVVLNDIPDYCVAVGSPAKIIKYFDKITGQWVKMKSDEDYYNYKKDLENSRPLLTIGIPTYNRSGYLERCLENIYRQIGNDPIIEVLVCNNCSTDATDKVIEKYKGRFSNLRVIRYDETIEGNTNILKSIDLARGEFVTPNGDDDFYSHNIIYEIVNMIYENRECKVMFTNPINCNVKINKGNGINEYIESVSYVCTFISGIILNKDSYDVISEKDKWLKSAFNQVYLQLELLKNNSEFCILNGNIFTPDSGEHKPYGYNFAEIFIKSYFDIMNSYIGKGLDVEVLRKEKLKLLNNMILPWVNNIKKNNIDLQLDNILEIFSEYYNMEEYFTEKFKELEEILRIRC